MMLYNKFMIEVSGDKREKVKEKERREGEEGEERGRENWEGRMGRGEKGGEEKIGREEEMWRRGKDGEEPREDTSALPLGHQMRV